MNWLAHTRLYSSFSQLELTFVSQYLRFFGRIIWLLGLAPILRPLPHAIPLPVPGIIPVLPVFVGQALRWREHLISTGAPAF